MHWAIQMVDALGFLAKVGIVHRDFRSHNIQLFGGLMGFSQVLLILNRPLRGTLVEVGRLWPLLGTRNEAAQV